MSDKIEKALLEAGKEINKGFILTVNDKGKKREFLFQEYNKRSLGRSLEKRYGNEIVKKILRLLGKFETNDYKVLKHFEDKKIDIQITSDDEVIFENPELEKLVLKGRMNEAREENTIVSIVFLINNKRKSIDIRLPDDFETNKLSEEKQKKIENVIQNKVATKKIIKILTVLYNKHNKKQKGEYSGGILDLKGPDPSFEIKFEDLNSEPSIEHLGKNESIFYEYEEENTKPRFKRYYPSPDKSWKLWNFGEMPVDGDTKVDIKLRSEASNYNVPAKKVYWKKNPRKYKSNDVRYWRLSKGNEEKNESVFYITKFSAKTANHEIIESFTSKKKALKYINEARKSGIVLHLKEDFVLNEFSIEMGPSSATVFVGSKEFVIKTQQDIDKLPLKPETKKTIREAFLKASKEREKYRKKYDTSSFDVTVTGSGDIKLNPDK
ncbi:MAG: hypothetical protein ACOC1O_00420 [bacterium]